MGSLCSTKEKHSLVNTPVVNQKLGKSHSHVSKSLISNDQRKAFTLRLLCSNKKTASFFEGGAIDDGMMNT